MGYPSLLFTGKASGQSVDLSVFEDVKLSMFFSPDAIGAMRFLCPSSDIPVRQELLRFLLKDEGCLASFNRLSSITAHINHLREALVDVKCENERHYIFVCLAAALSDFYEEAAGCPASGAFLTRFVGWFSAACSDGAWQKLSAEAKRLRTLAEEAQQFAFRMVEDNLWMRLEYRESYVEKLERCAEELGLPPTRTQRDTNIRLDARMVNALARLHPESFLAFKNFYAENQDCFDESILSYRYELNFYLEAVRLIRRIRAAGLPLCWPSVSDTKQLTMTGLRDISLLHKTDIDIIPNDSYFTEKEPFFFLTGANGGGKTTYLRSLGIAVLLFLSGCPVCCETAQLWPVDNVFTHFPQDERFEADGRFADEQRRMADIVSRHGGNSLILLNETFSTTNEELAVECTLKLADELKDSGSFVLYITHQHGLESSELPFLSVIVDESNSNKRTYRITRRAEAAGSYAADILRRYHLDKESLQKRAAASAQRGVQG